MLMVKCVDDGVFVGRDIQRFNEQAGETILLVSSRAKEPCLDSEITSRLNAQALGTFAGLLWALSARDTRRAQMGRDGRRSNSHAKARHQPHEFRSCRDQWLPC